MTRDIIQLRLTSIHVGSDNEIANLDVQVFANDAWNVLDLNIETPGFLIFVYSAFICQHMYLRTNAAELGLELDSITGQFEMMTTEDWYIQDMHASFQVKLRSGQAMANEIRHIVERMKNCPVSRNLKDVAKHTELQII